VIVSLAVTAGPPRGPLNLLVRRRRDLVRPTPRPDAFTLCCAGLLVAPAVVSLVAAVALVLTRPQALAGPAGIGAALGLFGSGPLLVVEYGAVVRRSWRSAAILAYLLLYLALLGSFAWIGGLLDWLRLKSPGPEAMSPGMFALYSTFLACAIVSGVGHLRWSRLLRAAAEA
jgi:hypothetical protein